MNATRSQTVSPISIDSNDTWSPVSRYQTLDNNLPYPSAPPSRNRVDTPPASVHTSASTTNSTSDGIGSISNQNGIGPKSDPSPPASIARSSDATGRYAPSIADSQASSRKQLIIEETLAEHYQVLRTYLAPYLRDDKGNPRPNRARDKLLRLSAVQFQELSTDVYDESLRREDERRERSTHPHPHPQQIVPGALPSPTQTPKHLLPKPNFHPKRNQARQKLSTLPLERFRQLATDVFYELERRFPKFVGGEGAGRAPSPALSTASSNRSGPRGNGQGPPPGWRGPRPGGPNGTGPPGQYTRDRPNGMSNGAGPRISENIVGGNVYGRPLPKTFQSNTIVPNKSTMVEDDDSGSADGHEDEDDGKSDAFGLDTSRPATTEKEKQISELKEKVDGFQARVGELEGKLRGKDKEMEGLEARLRDKDAELERLQTQRKYQEVAADAEKERWQRLQRDLDNKLDEALRLNSSLRLEIEKARHESSTTERGLRSELEAAKSTAAAANPDLDDNEWRARYEDLERELREQQQVTEDVRREASQFLAEMRALSERSEAALEKEEKLLHQVTFMESELSQWKARYAKAKTQLRTLRASSMGLATLQNPSSSLYVRDDSLVAINGQVKDVHITEFQLSIDELLQAGRQSNPQDVLDVMKTVVTNVRHIISDINAADSAHSSFNGIETPKLRSKLKARVSATANNLITASKNHAAASGLSPVSLLDAAASHLTTTIVELVKAVKIRPTPANELDGANESREDYFTLANGIGHLRQTSTTSAGSSAFGCGTNRSSVDLDQVPAVAPLATKTHKSINPAQTAGMEDLKNLLDTQTASLLSTVEALDVMIRSNPSTEAEESMINSQIESIAQNIHMLSTKLHNVLDAPASGLQQNKKLALEKHCLPVVDVLEDCKTRLLEAEEADKVPPLTYRISRALKELDAMVGRVEGGTLTAEMTLAVAL